MIYILMMAAPFIIAGIFRLFGSETETEGRKALPEVQTMTAPSTAQGLNALRAHLRNAIVLGAVGLVVAVVGGIALSNSSRGGEFYCFAMVSIGVYLAYSCVGRLWATGLHTKTWAGAEASIWRVTVHEADEDFDGFSSWFTLRVEPVSSNVQKSPTNPDLLLLVRMTPQSGDSDGTWVGRHLLMLERLDGRTVVTQHGKNRFFRAGGESPWDFVDRVLSSSLSSSAQRPPPPWKTNDPIRWLPPMRR